MSPPKEKRGWLRGEVVYDNGYAKVLVETQPDSREVNDWLYSVRAYVLVGRRGGHNVLCRVWNSQISARGVYAGHLWWKKFVSPEELLRQAVYSAKAKVDKYASDFPDQVERSRNALRGIKIELAVRQEVEVIFHKGRKDTNPPK